MDGYKVVRKANRSRKKFMPATVLGDQSVRYEVGKTTKRNERQWPFAVFTKKEDAERFLMNESKWAKGFALLKVTFVKSKETSLWWSISPGCKNMAKDWILPRGTHFADEVTPIEVLG
jgi:hypothetical protein